MDLRSYRYAVRKSAVVRFDFCTLHCVFPSLETGRSMPKHTPLPAPPFLARILPMIYRIDVRTTPLARGGEAAVDPVGEAVRHQIQEFGTSVGPIITRRIFLLDTDADRAQVERAARELLADPLVEMAEVVNASADDAGRSRIEIHLKPGVMDPVAESTEMALRDMGLNVREVRTGRAYLIEGKVS
ncbi:MAG: purL 2, partial [Phycisphaerales bacterium]|nr:purL 2 [Phycisphaerales bacterium]